MKYILIFLLISNGIYAFDFNYGMKHGNGCIYSSGKIVCRKGTGTHSGRHCFVNLYGEVICIQDNIHKSLENKVEDNQSDEETVPEPFFKIK
jgi:hypothetical protein